MGDVVSSPSSTLERTVALLKAQHEASLDGILVVDEHRKDVSYNRRFLEVWNIDAEFAARADDHGLIARVLSSLRDPERFLERVQYLYEHPLERSRDELRLKDGRILDRYSGPVISEDGEYFGRVWFFRDMTELRRAEEQVRELNRLGQYYLERKIGEGGMGIVYAARHALLRRPTAIKLLPTERAGDAAIRRFEREVQLTSQLTHPNTIVVFDYGRSSAGTFYYAMEYLDGLDLAALVEDYGPQPPGRVIHILEQACGALAEAHELGLIHRDIKPANLMITARAQAPDFVKVLDFGLVKVVDDRLIDEKSVENRAPHGGITGTPRFMSPEAISTPDRIDGRSDLYALGAVGYYLLTGKAVFESDVFVLLLTEILHTAPLPPSARLGRSIPGDLERIILDCLAKSPSERPANAIELRKRLLSCSCRAEYGEAEASAWWRRHREEPPVSRRSSAQQPPDPLSETVVGIDWQRREQRVPG